MSISIGCFTVSANIDLVLHSLHS